MCCYEIIFYRYILVKKSKAQNNAMLCPILFFPFYHCIEICIQIEAIILLDS